MNARSSESVAMLSPIRGLLGPCLRSAIVVALLTGCAYPLLTTGVAQLLLPHQASGSLIQVGRTVVGAAPIGQAFHQPRYFHPRPSATTASDPNAPGKTVESPYNAQASSGSNLGPTSQALSQAVAQRAVAYRQANGLDAQAPVPVDAVTSSASGLDPHISVANAAAQAQRVASARGLPVEQVRGLLAANTEGRLLGLWGEPRVHVLNLNRALDALQPGPQAPAQAAQS